MKKQEINECNMSDLISIDDLQKLKDIEVYIKCSSCKKILVEPKMCISCSKNLCNKCHKINCNHELIISRHLKSILEHIHFKCKFCEDPVSYDYFKLPKHLDNCKYFISYMNAKRNQDMFLENSLVKKDNELLDLLSKSELNVNVSKYLFLNESSGISFKQTNLGKATIEEKQEKFLSDFSCECGEKFFIKENNNKDVIQSVKENYLQHKKKCKESKNANLIQKEESVEKVKEKLVNDFMGKVKTMQNNFFQVSKLKNNDFLLKIEKEFNFFENTIEIREKNIEEYENEINEKYNQIRSYKHNEVPEEILLKNTEYAKLKLEKEDLLNRIKTSEKILNDNVNKYSELKEKSDVELKLIASEYNKKLYQLELEENWLKELIQPYSSNIISSIYSDSCSSCKNSDVKLKKYQCHDCKKRFCAGVCAKICSSSNCSKKNVYICPECTVKCGLCRKNKYCSDCKNKCFYSECKNKFCPDCYKKNSHQQRNGVNPCNFFTCDVHKEKCCLMTTIFCGKCERRLCNTCIFNDKEHFDTFFK